jgi:hypothetical protein
MIAGWFLILFILTIIFLLFVASFNIYEQERIKRKCKTCVENQDILLILNVIAMFLVLVLLFGYFFGRVSKTRVEALQQATSVNNKAQPPSPLKSSSKSGSYSPSSGTVVSNGSKATSVPATTSVSSNTSSNIGEYDNPFSYGGSIDIISKI